MAIGLLALAAGSLLGGTYLKNRQNSQALDRQQQNQEAYRGLLNQDLQRFKDREQSLFDNGIGPVNPGLLEQYTPSNEFLAQAAALPGRENLLQQAVIGEQAMARQRQGQIWESENMTMAQKAALEAQQQQRNWEQSRREFEYANPSAYQQEQLGLQQQGLGIQRENLALQRDQFGFQQQQAQQKFDQAQLMQQVPFLGMNPQQKLEHVQRTQRFDSAAAIATDTLDFLDRSGTGDRAMNPSQRSAIRAAYQQEIIPVLADMSNAGVLQPGELELMTEFAGNPGGWFNLDSTQKAKIKSILTRVNDQREINYRFMGEQAPQIGVGQSTFARGNLQASVPQENRRSWNPNLRVNQQR